MSEWLCLSMAWSLIGFVIGFCSGYLYRDLKGDDLP